MGRQELDMENDIHILTKGGSLPVLFLLMPFLGIANATIETNKISPDDPSISDSTNGRTLSFSVDSLRETVKFLKTKGRSWVEKST